MCRGNAREWLGLVVLTGLESIVTWSLRAQTARSVVNFFRVL
jgi:hypothetical protein